MTAAQQWRDELAAWAIRPEIVAAAPESPYGFPPGLFTAAPRPGPSRDRALAALPPGGSVLDVGCGGGSASLALVPPAGRLVGVDSAAHQLAEFAQAAASAGVAHTEILGSWPDSAAAAGVCDVAVCHHVAYNVPELAAFAVALTAAARHRVVLELTERHPWASLRELWQHFHGEPRPDGPSAELAEQVLREAGLAVSAERWQQPPRPLGRAEQVSFARRRLCLPVEREPELAALLTEDQHFPPRPVVSLWWPGRG